MKDIKFIFPQERLQNILIPKLVFADLPVTLFSETPQSMRQFLSLWPQSCCHILQKTKKKFLIISVCVQFSQWTNFIFTQNLRQIFYIYHHTRNLLEHNIADQDTIFVHLPVSCFSQTSFFSLQSAFIVHKTVLWHCWLKSGFFYLLYQTQSTSRYCSLCTAVPGKNVEIMF